ncbi:hypothetical protein ACPUER_20080 [Burkholderia sp. DN3021]|uniref:hypothetical protein n=1 Tax=Burkholderia sp. DN3021 TaxID=3410137 RepID=UPI003C7B306A
MKLWFLYVAVLLTDGRKCIERPAQPSINNGLWPANPDADGRIVQRNSMRIPTAAAWKMRTGDARMQGAA